MNKNLEALLAQERLINEVGWGKLETTFEIHNTEVKSIGIVGKQRNLYNRSKKDQNTNGTAVTDIIKRIDELLKGDKTNLTFNIEANKGRIKSVTWITKTSKSLTD